MSPEKAEKNFKKYYKLLKKNRKKKLDKLLYGNEGVVWERFKTEPCSAKYHGSKPGGLLEHSVLVTKALFKTMDGLASDRYSGSSLATVALFHDIGKIGNETHSAYINKTDSTSGKEYYEYNSDIYVLPHQVRSLKIIGDAGVKLNEEEYQAILYHNGLYVGSGEEIKYNAFALTLALHFADMWVTRVLNK